MRHLGVQDGRVDQIDLGAGDISTEQSQGYEGRRADGKALANGSGGVSSGIKE